MIIELLAAAFVGAAFASACTFAKSRRPAPSEEDRHTAFCAAMERRHS